MQLFYEDLLIHVDMEMGVDWSFWIKGTIKKTSQEDNLLFI